MPVTRTPPLKMPNETESLGDVAMGPVPKNSDELPLGELGEKIAPTESEGAKNQSVGLEEKEATDEVVVLDESLPLSEATLPELQALYKKYSENKNRDKMILSIPVASRVVLFQTENVIDTCVDSLFETKFPGESPIRFKRSSEPQFAFCPDLEVKVGLAKVSPKIRTLEEKHAEKQEIIRLLSLSGADRSNKNPSSSKVPSYSDALSSPSRTTAASQNSGGKSKSTAKNASSRLSVSSSDSGPALPEKRKDRIRREMGFKEGEIRQSPRKLNKGSLPSESSKGVSKGPSLPTKQSSSKVGPLLKNVPVAQKVSRSRPDTPLVKNLQSSGQSLAGSTPPPRCGSTPILPARQFCWVSNGCGCWFTPGGW